MKPKHLSIDGRRKFIKQAGITALGFWILPRHVLGGVAANGKKFLAPSDTINLGFIGGGKQGKILSNSFIGTGEIKIVALTEVYEAKANLFKEKLKEYISKNPGTVSNPEVEVHNDFRTLLERKDVDAVVIATPDHWHAVMAVHAARAGKDIYCEKPMALTVKEGRAMVNATRKYDRVFQTGNMQRSWKEFRQAVELIRNGYIGDIKSVKVNVGTPPVPYNLPAEQMPAGLDWTAWLGPNAFQNFNTELAPPITKDVYPNWRLYKEFGGGMVTDWGAHMFDIAQWALDMDNSGPVKFFPPDGKDHKVFTMYYDNGIELTHEKWDWNNAVWFTGTEGELKVARGKLETTPVAVKDKVIGNGEKHVYYSENHYKDFLAAMRNRNKPICDVEVGHRTASLAPIVNIGYELKRPLVWNPKKEKFKKDKEANKLLGRDMMNGWSIEV
jgi:predicted dehydrogenase